MGIHRFLILLKTKGSQTAAEIAKELRITTEGARLQLLKLEENGLVKGMAASKGVGRPQQIYSLTEEGNNQFPDTHADLSVQLLQTIRETLGEEALAAVIKSRETKTNLKYAREIESVADLERKVSKLVEIRSKEGYMAEYQKEENGFLLIENHCPICAAAQTCQGFCASELNTFRQILGAGVQIERINHILAGARRCAYKIQEIPATKS